MINVKDEVYGALCTVTENVTDYYPRSWEQDISIQYMEEDNKVAEESGRGEVKSYVRYRIDIWSRKSTSVAAVAVDAAISPLGLKRTQCMDVEDPSGLKHKQMRYEGIIDVRSRHVYHAIGKE